MSDESTTLNPLEPGDLLATVCFADVRWMSWGWSKALFIFERCLLYSAGHTRAAYRQGFRGTRQSEGRVGSPQWYAVRLDAEANRNVDALVATHPANWVVWSTEVAHWSLRQGIYASRLRLGLTDGTRRKVLWGRRGNPRPVIRAALERALDGEAHEQE